MKKNEFIQIKGLDPKELRVKAKALRGEIANLILEKNMKKLKDLKMISKKKKELAQILTVIRQKELLVQLESISRQSSDVLPSGGPQTENETDERQEKPKKSNKRKEKSES